MMKRIIIILALTIIGSLGANAQDSLNMARMDSTYVGKSIMNVIGPGAEVNQTQQVRQALDNYTQANAQKQLQVFLTRGIRQCLQSRDSE